MYKYIFLSTIFFTPLLAKYGIGNTISLDDQNSEFSYCYPSDSTTSTFNLSQHAGKVLMLEMSASW